MGTIDDRFENIKRNLDAAKEIMERVSGTYAIDYHVTELATIAADDPELNEQIKTYYVLARQTDRYTAYEQAFGCAYAGC